MPPKGSTLLAALVCALALPAAAQASPVIEVGGGHTVVRNDPVVPPPEPEPELGAVAVAARKPPPRGYRAVLRSLLFARRSHKISAPRYRGYVRTYRKARSVRRRLRGARGAQLGYVIA